MTWALLFGLFAAMVAVLAGDVWLLAWLLSPRKKVAK